MGRWGKLVLFALVTIVLLAASTGLVGLILHRLNIITGEDFFLSWVQDIPFWGQCWTSEGEGDISTELQQVLVLEKELSFFQEENASLRSDLEQRSREVQVLLQEIEQLRIEKRALEVEKQRHLRVGDIYGRMRSQEAAAILAQLSDEEALSVLLFLEAQQVGQILAQMEPKRAAVLTKLMNNPEGG